MYNNNEEKCDEEFFEKKVNKFDRISYFWIRGNLTTSFFINGFNCIYYILAWWIFYAVIKILIKIRFKRVFGKNTVNLVEKVKN